MVDKPTPLTYGSLFAGVGGFDMGMEQAGYEPVFQVEWDKNCLKVLHHHWPTVPKWGDVCDVNGADLPPCDVLIFGSPCQDLSVAGKRAGLQDGEKSSMFFEAVRIIKEMRDATNNVYPRATIWENVPGALSSNRGADLGIVLASLADIGADLQEYAVLDAQHFGVPQRRRRIFLISIFDPVSSERCPDPLLPVIQGSRGDFAKGRKARKDFARNVEGSLDPSGQWAAGSTDENTLRTSVTSKWSKGSEGPSGSEYYNMVVEGDESLIGALCARDFKGVGNQYVAENKLVVQEAFVKSRRAQSNTDDETWIEGIVTPTLNAFDNGGESRATVLMPVAYSIREDAKANNFSATETDTALCLSALIPSPQSHHAQIFIAEPQPPYVFDGTRHDDFRMDSETVPTLKQRMGTGGGQVPMVAEPVAYDEYNQKLDDTGVHRSLRIGRDSSDFVAQPTYAFDTQFGSNATVFEDQSPTLKGSQQSPSITMPGLAVRRLTPLECTKLMGWPDEWLEIGNLDAKDEDYKRQVLQHLWKSISSQKIQRHAGRLAGILTPEVLLAGVHGNWFSWDLAYRCASSAREIQGENAWPENFLQELWQNTQHRPSPYRRESFEQLANKLGRPMPFLSLVRTSPAKSLFYSSLWESTQGAESVQQALDSLAEMGRPFIYQEGAVTQADTNRYKQCGNGVATPVAAWVGKQLRLVLEM